MTRAMGRKLTRDWLLEELQSPPDLTDPDAVLDLAAAVGLVEDTWADAEDVTDLLVQGRTLLRAASPEVLQTLGKEREEDSLADELARGVGASDPAEVRDWLLAADELARGLRVLGLADSGAAAFRGLRREIEVYSPLYAPFVDVAEQQEDRGLGAHPERPLLDFWTALAMADLGAALLHEHAPPTDEGLIDDVLGALGRAGDGVVLDLAEFRRRAAQSLGLELAAADSIPELSSIPDVERIGDADGWEAFLQIDGVTVVVAVYGPDAEAQVTLSGPSGPVAMSWRADHWAGAVDEAGSWTLVVNGERLPFRLDG